MSNPTTTVRPGEELPLDALSDYLSNQWPGFSKINTLRQFPGGYSNLTYLLETDAGAAVLRRPPVGAQIKSAHDMGREFRVLSLLRGHFDKIPQPVLFCEDETIIGAPFYLMEQVQGVILRSKPPKEFQLTPDLMRRISEAAVDTLAALHGIDVEATGLIQLGKPQGYIERQTTGWTERYRKSETDTVADMDAVAAWLNAHRPEAPTGPKPPRPKHCPWPQPISAGCRAISPASRHWNATPHKPAGTSSSPAVFAIFAKKIRNVSRIRCHCGRRRPCRL
jgi:aminoglycoside phosphotransferase (APT) family kinase protein